MIAPIRFLACFNLHKFIQQLLAEPKSPLKKSACLWRQKVLRLRFPCLFVSLHLKSLLAGSVQRVFRNSSNQWTVKTGCQRVQHCPSLWNYLRARVKFKNYSRITSRRFTLRRTQILWKAKLAKPKTTTVCTTNSSGTVENLSTKNQGFRIIIATYS